MLGQVIVSATVIPGPNPEPSTWAMILVGFVGLGGLARLRKRTISPA